MADSLHPVARAALIETLTERVERLVNAQAKLADQRASLLAMQRRNDRELSDCRATARLFDLEIDIPTPDRDEVLMRDREMFEMDRQQRALAEQLARQRAHADIRAANLVRHPGPNYARTAALSSVIRPPPEESKQIVMRRPPKPPAVKVFLSQRLKDLGSEGSKAAPLREAYARAFGVEIHEKTVGMTLYRMANEGTVRREGHTWFLADPPSEPAENPGVDAPGPEKLL